MTAALIVLAIALVASLAANTVLALKYRSDTGKLTTDLIGAGKREVEATDNMLRASRERDEARAQAMAARTESAALTVRLKTAQSAANAAREGKARHAEIRARAGDGAAVLGELLQENLTGQAGDAIPVAVADRGEDRPSAVSPAGATRFGSNPITTLK